MLLLRQPVGAWQLVGVGCAVIALTFAGGGQRSGLSRRGLALALVAAVGFGLWFIFLERAAVDGQLWALVSARGAATVFLGVPALLRGGASGMRASRGLVLVAGATDVAANGLVVLAFPSVGVGIAAALSGMYPISTMLLARLLLGDRLPRQGQAAVLLAVAGVVLISLGG